MRTDQRMPFRTAYWAILALLSAAAAAPSAALTATPTPVETPTRPCGPTGTPYCADHCVPCPTIRANCYANACGACQENPVCAPDEICLGTGFYGCCSCVIITPTSPVGSQPTPTPTPEITPTSTRPCGPTATPYCADHCVPCPTIRANCYADACGECHENPVCAPNEICLGSGFGGCCTCVTPTVYPGPSATPTAPPGPETPVAARCAGDCNGDGTITIDELVAAVIEALGTAGAACPSVDRNGDGDVRIDDLMALVSGALDGCGPTTIASVVGIYDVEATQSGPTFAFDRSGLALVEHRDNRLIVGITFDQLNGVTLTAEVPPDGDDLVFDGGGYEGGDVAFGVHGSGAFSVGGDLIRLDAVVDVDSFVSVPSRITARITRPKSGTPSAYGGTHVLDLQHVPYHGGAPYISRVELQVDVPASGRATCGATQDRGTDGAVLASLPAVECQVSPSGRFKYYALYENGEQFPLPLQLLGHLGADVSEVGMGSLYIAQFPSVSESGSWTAHRNKD